MRTVLIADNDKRVLEHFDAYISSMNYFVATADNAQDLFRIVKMVVPDMVIVSDDLNGLSVDNICSRLVHEVGAAVPLVIAAEDEFNTDANCSMVVKKPLTNERVKNLILNLTPQLFI